jgi:ABC-type uncharacterized transport system substrate-binding protein
MSSPADIYMVTGGGLMPYAPNLVNQFRPTADYVDRILKGEKPSELPAQFPVKFELVINLKPLRRSASTCLCNYNSAVPQCLAA